MLINIQDWTFSVDTDATVAFSSNKLTDQCQCGYCRNYYHTIDHAYPALRSFLADFGVYADAPDELMPFEPTLYSATFCVSGSILHYGTSHLKIDGMEIRVIDENDLDFPTRCPKPFFALSTSVFEVPWVLDEDMNEVVSPANEPEYLERMWKKLLDAAPSELMQS